MSRDVIARKYLPTQLPSTLTFLNWFFMDRYHAPGWLQGVVWTMLALIWIACVVTMFKEKYVKPSEI